MRDLKIGTSGYDYLDWIGSFYPEGLPRKEFLPYYAGKFETLELNFSYYKMPVKSQLVSMLERSGSNLDFSIKAHESLTHKVEASKWRSSAVEYQRGVEALYSSGRLSAVLMQFPFSFRYEPENRRYLKEVLEEMGMLPLVVEFRNAEWLNSRVFESLMKMGVGYCCVDEPQLKGLPPSLDVVTSNVGYIRFHGRNAKDWRGSDAAARFDYLYSSEELEGWSARIKGMLERALKLRIYFNNHRRGQSPKNAGGLIKILREAGI